MNPSKVRAVQTSMDIEPLMEAEESGSEEKNNYSVFPILSVNTR